MLTIQAAREQENHHNNWADFLEFHCDHACEQLKARYGIDLTYGDWEKVNEAIFREKAGTFLFQPNYITSVYTATLRGTPVGLFFSETAYCVTSFIPITDTRLQGKRLDGSTDGYNFISTQRKRRLALARQL